mmetsp:Transcript_35960/g.89775  ORF Transcript_35960/g.89775 Transcript_35960/m.89775 type:complete len:288 (-) Transcript_35960:452-1315(-)
MAPPTSREEPGLVSLPALNTTSVMDVLELETERLKLRVAQALTVLQTEAYSKLQSQLAEAGKDYRTALLERDERVRVLEMQARGQTVKLESAVLKMLNLAGKSGERYNVLDGMRLCRSVWRMWTRYLLLARRERQHGTMPDQHFGKALSRKVLCAWRSAARTERIARVDYYWRGQVDEARSLAAADHREQVLSLQLQLQQAHEQINISMQERDALEDELKRAFMRGVCALNMEAVSILRHGSAVPLSGDQTANKRGAPEGSELRSLQEKTGEAMLELSKYGPQANRS